MSWDPQRSTRSVMSLWASIALPEHCRYGHHMLLEWPSALPVGGQVKLALVSIGGQEEPGGRGSNRPKYDSCRSCTRSFLVSGNPLSVPSEAASQPDVLSQLLQTTQLMYEDLPYPSSPAVAFDELLLRGGIAGSVPGHLAPALVVDRVETTRPSRPHHRRRHRLRPLPRVTNADFMSTLRSLRRAESHARIGLVRTQVRPGCPSARV